MSCCRKNKKITQSQTIYNYLASTKTHHPCAQYTPDFAGAGKRSRTPDLRITNALLYQLSYSGLNRTYAKFLQQGMPTQTVRSAQRRAREAVPRSRSVGPLPLRRSFGTALSADKYGEGATQPGPFCVSPVKEARSISVLAP